MRRIAHGSTTPPSGEKSTEDVQKELGPLVDEYFFPITEGPVDSPGFTYMFKDLAQDKKCLIPQTDETLEHLSKLGAAMRDTQFDPKFDSAIPAAYTYFAQLVNHDINFTNVKKNKDQTDFQFLAKSDLGPLSDEAIFELVSNKRDGMLELDCLYGRMQAGVLPPREKDNHDKMALGQVSQSGNRPKGKDKDNAHDLVRGEKSPQLKNDRTALIGDRRNDSNIILSQLHVAFLRAHNNIIDKKKCSFDEAKRFLLKHYHWLILEDFLPAIVPEDIIKQVSSNPNPLYHAKEGLPFEFSVGAFRFGHSMIRRSYYFNDNFQGVNLAFLFTLTSLSQHGGAPTPGEGFDNLPENRIIQWRRFLDGSNAARKFRTQVVEPLFELPDDVNINPPGERSLAVQDLKRSFMLRIPSGQAVADSLGVTPLKPEDLAQVSTQEQFQLLKDARMIECTPLSFYVLAEAALANNGKLGEVGGRIVAEVLIGLLRDRPDSIIGSDWRPDLGLKPETFFLSDLLSLAGVLEDA